MTDIATPPAHTTTQLTTESPLASAHPVSTQTMSDTRQQVTAARLIRSEWLKLRSVRSSVFAIGGSLLAAVVFGALFSSLAGTEEGPRGMDGDALSLSLAGFDIAVLVIAIFGVSMVAAEYQSGLIRTWFAATGRRLGLLWAKASVYFGVVLAGAAAATVAAFSIGQAVYPDAAATFSIGDDGVLQALAGLSIYAAAVAAMGVALGFLVRSTAAGASIAVGILMLAPGLIGLLPESISDPVAKVLPSNAAAAIAGLSNSGTELLSAGWGAVTLLVWTLGTTGAAAVALRRRDA